MTKPRTIPLYNIFSKIIFLVQSNLAALFSNCFWNNLVLFIFVCCRFIFFVSEATDSLLFWDISSVVAEMNCENMRNWLNKQLSMRGDDCMACKQDAFEQINDKNIQSFCCSSTYSLSNAVYHMRLSSCCLVHDITFTVLELTNSLFSNSYSRFTM